VKVFQLKYGKVGRLSKAGSVLKPKPKLWFW